MYFIFRYRKALAISLLVLLVIGIVLFVYQRNERKQDVFTAGFKKGETPANRVPIIPTSFTIDGATGEARIIGIKISSFEKDTITASGAINGVPALFTINLNKKTVIKNINATSSLKNLKTGDTISVVGTFISLSPNFTMLGQEIKFFGGK